MTSGFAGQTGMEYMLKTIDQAKAKADSRNDFAPGSALNYFKWEPGETKVIRFLSDDMITADFYDFIQTTDPAKQRNFMVDPANPDRLDRYRSATPGVGWKKPWQSSTLEEPKKTKRGVCVAVLRQEVRDPATGKLEVKDYLYDRDVDGKPVPSRYFGIVQQTVSNFWRPISSIFTRFGSIAVVDLQITRQGTERDTIYTPIPIEDPNLTDKALVKDFYFYGQPWDPNDEQRFLKCPQTTAQWAAYFSGEEYYRRHLSTEGATPATPPAGGLGEFHPATTHNDEAQAMRSSGTTFDSLSQTLLSKARENQQK
jgi:hypothetical protein